MESLLHKIQCGCVFDANGAWVNRCAGHASQNAKRPIQRGKHETPTSDVTLSPPTPRARPDRSAAMVGLVFLALAFVVGVAVGKLI